MTDSESDALRSAIDSSKGRLPWAVFPYMADVDQVVTRRYRSATFSAIQASFRQLGSGLATILVDVILGTVGFDSTRSVQTPAANPPSTPKPAARSRSSPACPTTRSGSTARGRIVNVNVADARGR
ncbi:MFS transporter [Bifidobacterium rousetti]|uniref:MFS transporter n=1 Tax=Bifidobacterium rousetti TaxID=2045439 RepID=UPI00168B44DC|nr:MFS transporter [Bifidobacterium rousetti]